MAKWKSARLTIFFVLISDRFCWWIVGFFELHAKGAGRSRMVRSISALNMSGGPGFNLTWKLRCFNCKRGKRNWTTWITWITFLFSVGFCCAFLQDRFKKSKEETPWLGVRGMSCILLLAWEKHRFITDATMTWSSTAKKICTTGFIREYKKSIEIE